MVRKTINITLTTVVLSMAIVLLLLMVAESDAQNSGERHRSSDINFRLSDEDVPRLVEIIRIWKLTDELNLGTNQLMEFLPKFKKLNNLKSEYYGKRRSSIEKLEKLLKSNPSQEQIKRNVEEFRASEREFFEQIKETEDSLNSILTVKQQARFIVFQDRYRNDMRKLLRSLNEIRNEKEQQIKRQPLPLGQQKGRR